MRCFSVIPDNRSRDAVSLIKDLFRYRDSGMRTGIQLAQPRLTISSHDSFEKQEDIRHAIQRA